MVAMWLRGLFSGKAEVVSAELEHAEKVMLEHEKHHFSEKHIKHQKEKNGENADPSQEKYSSLYSSFDVLKSHQDFPPGLHKVFCVDNTTLKCWMCLNNAYKMYIIFLVLKVTINTNCN